MPTSPPPPSRENGYTIPNGYVLNQANLTALFADIFDYLQSLSQMATDAQAVVDAGTGQALAMVAENIAPVLDNLKLQIANAQDQLTAMQGQINDLLSGITADQVNETASRVFVTPADKAYLEAMTPDQITLNAQVFS